MYRSIAQNSKKSLEYFINIVLQKFTANFFFVHRGFKKMLHFNRMKNKPFVPQLSPNFHIRVLRLFINKKQIHVHILSLKRSTLNNIRFCVLLRRERQRVFLQIAN